MLVSCVIPPSLRVEDDAGVISPPAIVQVIGSPDALAEAKEKFQREYINEVLALNNGNRTKTARDLGVDPRTVFRHLEKESEDGSEIPQEPV